jgi:hypothetical protein
MSHSKAYKCFVEAYNAKGAEKQYLSYQPDLFNEIYDWERENIEDMIWKKFKIRKTMDLVIFFPELKKYDGKEALLSIFGKPEIDPYNRILITLLLFKITGEKKYINIFKNDFYYLNDLDRFKATVDLLHSTSNIEILNLLFDIYINDIYSAVRTTAIKGIFHQRGYINDSYSIQESNEMLELIDKFKFENKKNRKKVINILKNGDLNGMKD